MIDMRVFILRIIIFQKILNNKENLKYIDVSVITMYKYEMLMYKNIHTYKNCVIYH